MGVLENGAAGTVRGGAQEAGLCVKLTFGLLTDRVTGFPSSSGFVLLLQISIFALPVIQGLPGHPLVAFTWSLTVAYLHAGSLFQGELIIHINCRWPEWFQKRAAPGLDGERNYKRPGAQGARLPNQSRHLRDATFCIWS